MNKIFNVNGSCEPDLHYMVDLSERLQAIKIMVDDGQYFSINRARQYGKTTVLNALAEYLKGTYLVISLNFQLFSYGDFETEQRFVSAFSREILDCIQDIPEFIQTKLEYYSTHNTQETTLSLLFKLLMDWCRRSDKKIVLIIDEVDTATNNQVFIDFLAQLRAYYLKRRKSPTFQSVILAGVCDVRNIKRKIRSEEEYRMNSPWNIASQFCIDMSFSIDDISGMLQDYEAYHLNGMNIGEISSLLYHYTSGYPYLVSRICKIMDEELLSDTKSSPPASVWTKEGFLKAVRYLLQEQSPLFESLTDKINDYPELKKIISRLLFEGQNITYNPDDPAIQTAQMFGFIKVEHSFVVISNRIFETRLYNMFLTLSEIQSSDIFAEGSRQRTRLIKNGRLDMTLVLRKFVEYFDEIYGDQNQQFLEEDGRRYFMLYLKPIINGAGNYYIESKTRNNERTDMIIDYQGEQFILEMKIWRGNSYNARGEKQLSDYLDYYHLNKGYMLSFNFNKSQKIGVQEICLGDKILVEAVV